MNTLFQKLFRKQVILPVLSGVLVVAIAATVWFITAGRLKDTVGGPVGSGGTNQSGGASEPGGTDQPGGTNEPGGTDGPGAAEDPGGETGPGGTTDPEREIRVSGIKTNEDRNALWEVKRPVVPPKNIKFLSHKTTGIWAIDREDLMSVGPGNCYDGKPMTIWNPQASGNYLGNPGIIFLLNGYYDLNSIICTFGTRQYFFNIFVSEDGVSFTEAAKITKDNQDRYYSGLTFTLGGLEYKKIAFIKLVFTGNPDNATWLSFAEIDVEGNRTGDGPEEIPEQPKEETGFPDVPGATVSSCQIVGSWVDDRSGAASYGASNSYDGNVFTNWNPNAQPSYAGDPGIVYTLNKAYNLKQIVLAFNGTPHYFDLYTSSDGSSYTKLAAISRGNEARAYTNLICTLDGLQANNVRYIKLIFTGRSGNSTWVALADVLFSETGAAPGDNGWMLPETEAPEENLIQIAGSKTSGQWVNDRSTVESMNLAKSYDGNNNTVWNPCAPANYAGEPGAVYTLDGYYDLDKIKLRFDAREYFFDLYTSTDGQAYTLRAQVTAGSYAGQYQGLVCALDVSGAEQVKYVKVVFTGNTHIENTAWVSLAEITVTGTEADGPELPPDDPETAAITGHTLSGTWLTSREGTGSFNPSLSYDGNLATNWNPQANSGYTGAPGIIYTLNGYYDLSEIILTFGARKYYFDLYAGTDGQNFALIAQITSANAAASFQDLVCTVDAAAMTQIKYLKMVFTGAESNATWVSLFEIAVTGTPADPPTDTRRAAVTGHTLSGTWLTSREGTGSYNPSLSYDGNTATNWNPQASGSYAGAPGIVYTLDGYYDLSEIVLTFGTRKYYFDLFASANGQDFTLIARITSANAAAYYQNLICTADASAMTQIKYLKVVFTGAESNATWVSLFEIAVTGTPAAAPSGGFAPLASPFAWLGLGAGVCHVETRRRRRKTRDMAGR